MTMPNAQAQLYPLLSDINRTDLLSAIRLGAQPMQRWFDWEHGGLPLFTNEMGATNAGNAHHSSYSLSHVPGRWLDALLNAEDVAGVEIDPRIEKNLRFWLLESVSNRMQLPGCLDLKTFAQIPLSDLHNLREVMHGLAALCRFRGDNECEERGEALIATVERYLDMETGVWDEARFNHERGGRTFFSDKDNVMAVGWDGAGHVPGRHFPQTFGRYIGALMRFHAATGSTAALAQAVSIRNLLMTQTFRDPEHYDAEILGAHTHSVTSAMSGLARFAAATGDMPAFDRIEELLAGAVAEITTDFGWCTENTTREDDYGEINNSADIVETMLLLGLAGRDRYFQSAESILRSHILPSQLRDARFIADAGYPDLAEGSRGAFGFPCPYGVVDRPGGWVAYNWDIVGGGVSGLCEAARAVASASGADEAPLVSINMLFDGRYNGVTIQSPYAGDESRLIVRVERACTLKIHMPDWCEETPKVSDAGAAAAVQRVGPWLFVFGLAAGDKISLEFPLAMRERGYRTRGGTFTAAWRGDEIYAMDLDVPRPLRFIPPLTN